MAAGLAVGITNKLYYNSATYASPTWVLIPIVQDVAISLEQSFAEVKSRLSTWILNLSAMKDMELTFSMLNDTSNATRTFLRDAWVAQTVVDMAIADQLIATTGCEYLRSDMLLGGFSPDQALEEANTIEVTAKPAYHATHVPTFVNV